MSIHPDERRKYTERYGKPAWTNAVDRAAGHRSRAENDYRLTEHFTATEWLDLCADWDFRCAFCRTAQEGFLTPHHLLPLSRCGGNDIGNILPICRECHTFIHDFRINCHPEWLPVQFALVERFEVGDFVYYSPQPDARKKTKPSQRHALGAASTMVATSESQPMGLVTEVVPPTRRGSLAELRGISFGNTSSIWLGHSNGIAVIEAEVTCWTRSQARVSWACRPHMMPRDQHDLVDLEDLEKVDIQTRMAALNQAHIEQSEVYAKQHQLMHQFNIGEWVDFGDRNRPHQGVILEIAPPVLHTFDFLLADAKDLHLVPWPSVTPAGARLKWLTRKGLPGPSNLRVSLVDITRARNVPALDERWVKQWEAWKGLTKPRSLYPAVKAVKEASRKKR